MLVALSPGMEIVLKEIREGKVESCEEKAVRLEADSNQRRILLPSAPSAA